MPEQAFAQSLQIAGSGFDQKLQGLMSVGQAIAQGQMMKHQMAQQMQQQKDLIDYRADTQFEYQQRLQTEIQGPAEEARALAQRQQAFIESIPKAKAKANEWAENHSDNYDKLNNYYLFDVTFNHSITPDETTGLVTPTVYLKNNDGDYTAIGYSEYLQEADRRLEFANWIEQLEQDRQEGLLRDNLTEEEKFIDGKEVLTAQNVEDMVTSMRADPTGKTSEELYLSFREGRFALRNPATPEDPSSRSRGDSAFLNVVAGINTLTGGKGVLDLSNVETEGRLLWKEDVKSTSTIDFTSTTTPLPELLTQLNETATKFFGLDLSTIPAEERQAILRGMPREVSSDYREIAEEIEKIREEPTRKDTFDTISQLYFNIESGYQEWVKQHGNIETAVTDKNLIRLNIRPTGLKNLFIPIEMNSGELQAQQTAQQLGLLN